MSAYNDPISLEIINGLSFEELKSLIIKVIDESKDLNHLNNTCHNAYEMAKKRWEIELMKLN